MRRQLKRLFVLGVLVAILATVGSATAGARTTLHHATVAAPLAAAARHSAPHKLLRVIVSGPSAAAAAGRYGTSVRRLGFGDAVTTTVQAGRLAALESDPGVSLV